MKRAILLAPILLLASSAVVHAQAEDHAPVNLPYASKMTQGKGESWTYFKPNLNMRKYRSVIVDTTSVYAGPDAQFDDINPETRSQIAQILTDALRAELGKSFQIVAKPRADTVRLRVTLLGAEGTKGGVATATRVTPLGFASNAVKSIAGKPGRFTGSLLYALEVNDGPSGELQIAAVRRRSPDALDIPATVSTTETVKAVAREFAEEVRKKLEKATGKTS